MISYSRTSAIVIIVRPDVYKLSPTRLPHYILCYCYVFYRKTSKSFTVEKKSSVPDSYDITINSHGN